MADLLQQFNTWKLDGSSKEKVNANASVVFICCAGENDIGSRSIDQILDTFRTFLDAVFQPNQQPTSSILIFLGPKFEPWLIDDNTSRKQYTKLNNGLQRAIRKHHSAKIVYIDCLTLFCTDDTKIVPGAVTSKALPDSRYFDNDRLHLNDTGYGVWKQIVEEKIQKYLIP